MMTHNQIKKGLAGCKPGRCVPDCPYGDMIGCVQTMHRDTLAMIQQLEAQVPKWICVVERLPENFATVIIWRSDCKNACIGWLIDGRWSVPKSVRVTHWMPLPEPPKEDDYAQTD